MLLVLLVLLVGAVAYDLVSHRIPNYYLLLGLAIALAIQSASDGWPGALMVGAGFFSGLAVFLPFYLMGGMAAGDVKLMAVVGAFLGCGGVLWAAAVTLIAGAGLGIGYLLVQGQLKCFLKRYWAMASLNSYIPAEPGDAARHRFPYALAIAVGTLMSLYWEPVGFF